MTNKKATKIKFLSLSILAILLSASCTRFSNQNSSLASTNGSSDLNLVQSVEDASNNTLNPVTKMFGNAINTIGGFSGNLLTVTIDAERKYFLINLTVPMQIGSVPTALFDKYPDIQYSVSIDASGNSILKLEIPIQSAIAIYKEWKNKQQAVVALPSAPVVTPTAPIVSPVVVSPPANAQSIVGKYSGEIINGNPGKTWCDGSFPEGYADIQANPGNYDAAICTYGYGLFGSFEFEVFADGRVEGKMQVIYAHNVHPIGGAHVGTGTETTFHYPGALGRLKFNSDGTVSGRIWEPKGFLSGDRTELVGGVISGRKQ